MPDLDTELPTSDKPIKNQTNGNGRVFENILRLVFIIIPIAIIGNIVYIFVGSKINFGQVLENIEPGYLLLALALILIPEIFHSMRVFLWSRVFGHSLKPTQAMKAVMVNNLASVSTPTMAGGGYAKVFYLIKAGFTPGQAALAMLLGSFEDIIFLVIAIPSAVVFTSSWNNPHLLNLVDYLSTRWPIAALAAAALIIIYLLINRRKKTSKANVQSQDSTKSVSFPDRIKNGLVRFRKDFKEAAGFILRHGKATFAVNSLLASLGWLCRYGSINALILGMGYEVDIVFFGLLHWIVLTTMTLIPTPGAVGGAEVVFGLIFGSFVPLASIPLLTGVWRFFVFYLNVLIAAFCLLFTGPGIPVTKNGESKSKSSETIAPKLRAQNRTP